MALVLAEKVYEPWFEAKPLPRRFFLRDTTVVARELLGKGLFVRHEAGPLLVEIVEVEAYLGARDPASHTFRGPNRRNRSMFALGGTCYVYLSYGINYCMNVVTQSQGIGEGVLIRAAAPLVNGMMMVRNRGLSLKNGIDKLPWNTLNGPGKLTQGLGIDLSYDGLTYDTPDFKLIDLKRNILPEEVGVSGRIGISRAKDEPLRFFLKTSPWLSRKA